MSDAPPSDDVDLYDTTYGHFQADVRAEFRAAVYGEEIGQNSWLTADEHRQHARWLALGASSRVLELASGSGGPALFLARETGAHFTGVDVNPQGVQEATASAAARGLQDRATFLQGDATSGLPFPDHAFDAVLCIDAINHMPHRAATFREWHRVLRPGGRLLVTDTATVTGELSKDEIAIRSSIGFFLFVPLGRNAALLAEAGFTVERCDDTSDQAALVARRSVEVRERLRQRLLAIEGEATFAGLQRFFGMVHRLSEERRLTRYTYLARA